MASSPRVCGGAYSWDGPCGVWRATHEAGLGAQLQQIHRVKAGGVKVEFLPRGSNSLMASESDWCKARVFKIGPDAVVDLKVLSGPNTGKILERFPIARLRGPKRTTATVKFFWAMAAISFCFCSV